MTYSTLASIVKYPYASSLAEKKGKFGFFTSEKDDFVRIADELGMIRENDKDVRYCRHPLVYLVEAADDICYQIMDIEDAHKLKILTTEKTKELLLGFFSKERQQHMEDVMTMVTDINEQIAYKQRRYLFNGKIRGGYHRTHQRNSPQSISNVYRYGI